MTTTTELKVPELAESVSEATLLEWNKNPGDSVVEGEVLVNIETDKIVLDVPSPCNGLLKSILKETGDSVGSGEVLALLVEGDPSQETSSSAHVVAEQPELANPAESSKSKNVIALPSAKKIAAEKDLPLDKVSGSGKGGRVLKEDVISGSRAEPQQAISMGGERRVPMTRLRVRVAERLLESQRNAAILTTFNEIDMKAVIDLRSTYRDKFEANHDVRLGFMSFFVKASIHALKKFPVINASVDGTDIVYHESFDIGVAVSTPRGLVVPIVRGADMLSFADIERQISDFGHRAQEGKLSIEEITGGTFSISNGGVFGSMLSTPIINPPQSAILGIHATKNRPVVIGDQIVIRPMNYFALSYDHRIIDGKEAVQFLSTIKDVLEDPARLLLEI